MQYAIIWKNGKYSWSRPIIKSYYVLVFTVKQCIAGVFLGFCEIPLVHSFYYDFLIVVLRSTSKTESSTTIGRYLCRQPQLVVTFAINHNWSLPLPSTKIGRYLCLLNIQNKLSRLILLCISLSLFSYASLELFLKLMLFLWLP